jgi:hypothetical protein
LHGILINEQYSENDMSRNNLSNSENVKSNYNDLNLQKNYTLGADSKFQNTNHNQI